MVRGVVSLMLVLAACTVASSAPPSSSPDPPPTLDEALVVPDLVGQNFLIAAFDQRRTFDVKDAKYVVRDDLTNGTIVSQRPEPGTPIEGTDHKIWVVVSQVSDYTPSPPS